MGHLTNIFRVIIYVKNQLAGTWIRWPPKAYKQLPPSGKMEKVCEV